MMPAPPLSKIREICLLCLFAQQSCPEQDPHFCQMLASQLKVSLSWVNIGWQRARAWHCKLSQVDELIDEAILGYEKDRLGAVERAAMRLGICEMLFDDAIPAKVAIAEAMRLVGKFSNRKSASLVNAVMDAILKKTI